MSSAGPGEAHPRRVVRQAQLGDIRALVELRALMFEAMGVAGALERSWQGSAAAWFHLHLEDRHHRLVVVSVEGHVVACAAGSLQDRIPGPDSTGRRQVLISNVATDPAHRRRGHARAAVAEVVRWAREESGVGRAELLATGDGAELYREFGFHEQGFPLMRAVWDS